MQEMQFTLEGLDFSIGRGGYWPTERADSIRCRGLEMSVYLGWEEQNRLKF